MVREHIQEKREGQFVEGEKRVVLTEASFTQICLQYRNKDKGVHARDYTILNHVFPP